MKHINPYIDGNFSTECAESCKTSIFLKGREDPQGKFGKSRPHEAFLAKKPAILHVGVSVMGNLRDLR